jgi:aarF domain-containing kinase
MARLVSEKGDVFSRRVNLDELLKEIMRLFRKHGVSIDGVYASLVVSLCVLVGFATSLDPQVNLFEVAAPSVMAFALTGDVMGRLFEA